MLLDILSDLDLFYYKATWQETFAWLPHVCKRSGRRIWLERAYQGTAMYTGPGEPVYEHHWHSSKEHLIWLLTKTN
jgi:uncharacterized cupin superfamily protein